MKKRKWTKSPPKKAVQATLATRVRFLRYQYSHSKQLQTSIDALAVGVSFAALSVNVAFAAGTIALTTALTCGIALVVGRRFGNALGERATIIGGIVLILIGLKSLLF